MSRIVSRPSTATAAVFLGILAVVALVTIALGGSGPVAVKVGDATVSRADLDDELRVLGTSEALAKAVGAENVSVGPGSLLAAPGTGIVSSRVQELLFRQYLDRVGEKVTADDYQSSISLREGSAIGAVFATLPQWYRELYTERLAAFAAFSRVTGAGDDQTQAQRIIRREIRRTPIEVEAEYGRWAPRQISVVPYTPPTD